MASSYMSLEVLTEKESLGIHDCYFEPLGYVGSIRYFFDFILKIRTTLQALYAPMSFWNFIL